jgi:hypothetical protein
VRLVKQISALVICRAFLRLKPRVRSATGKHEAHDLVGTLISAKPVYEDLSLGSPEDARK